SFAYRSPPLRKGGGLVDAPCRGLVDAKGEYHLRAAYPSPSPRRRDTRPAAAIARAARSAPRAAATPPSPRPVSVNFQHHHGRHPRGKTQQFLGNRVQEAHLLLAGPEWRCLGHIRQALADSWHEAGERHGVLSEICKQHLGAVARAYSPSASTN